MHLLKIRFQLCLRQALALIWQKRKNTESLSVYCSGIAIILFKDIRMQHKKHLLHLYISKALMSSPPSVSENILNPI